ncbi:hypothetical protein AGLY_004420 [Aphis glycines]|uniref:Uncharacterized protein n=1 Tax=Aphis glycines TaxID=307491 RepID=A0A6G0TY62_APHGL|nr:hypothetical protein AGLY_004420 [Aphis glycines]
MKTNSFNGFLAILFKKIEYQALRNIKQNKLSNRTKTGIGCTTFMKNNSNHPKAPRSPNAIVYEQGDNYYSECNVIANIDSHLLLFIDLCVGVKTTYLCQISTSSSLKWGLQKFKILILTISNNLPCEAMLLLFPGYPQRYKNAENINCSLSMPLFAFIYSQIQSKIRLISGAAIKMKIMQQIS